MDTTELLRTAWQLVQDSGVPEPLYAAAFGVAVADLRGAAVPRGLGGGSRADISGGPPVGVDDQPGGGLPPAGGSPPAGNFYDRLADESGARVEDLRHILDRDGDGFRVFQVNRELGGGTKAELVRTVVALLAGAYHVEADSVDIDIGPIRDRVRARKLLDGNFSGTHVAALEHFSYDTSTGRLRVGPGWHEEFCEAVDRVMGRGGED